jgi:hypothetical protein
MIHQTKSNDRCSMSRLFRAACIRDFCFWQISLQKPKIERIFVGHTIAAMAVMNTKTDGPRFGGR